jgi:cation:H+ antiporter
MTVVILILALLAMLWGADMLVNGCVRLSRRIHLSPFFVSVIIIGVGTSLPELIISIISAAGGNGTLAVSNTIGSNIVNILGILGIGALIYPIAANYRAHKMDLAFVWLASVGLMYTIADGTVSRGDGIMLLLIFIAYVLFSMREHKYTPPAAHRHSEKMHLFYKIAVPIVFGIALLYFGSDYFMRSLESIAKNLGMNSTLAGILIVAPGTSAPELLITIMAAIRRQAGVALGNILGSNMANIVIVVATGALIAPLAVSPHLLHIDIWIMLGALMLLSVMMRFFGKISRTVGIVFLCILGAYFAGLIYAN